MSVSTRARSRRGALFAALLVAAGALVIMLFVHRRSRPRATDESVETAEPAPVAPRLATAAPEPPREDEPGAPIIDEIRVEKPEVCEGEENLITIKAHTPAGRDDAFLHYTIGGVAGRSIPVRALAPSELGGVGPQSIQVFGRGNAVTMVDVPSYTVKKCRPDRVLLLKSRQVPNSTDELELTAILRETGPSPPLRVTSYRWSFGDGRNAVTEAPSAVHRFEPPNADALYAEFLVACEAVGGDGRTVLGRTAISLRNREFENLEFQKTLVLSSELTPRFPQLDSRGQVVQRVRLYHHRDVTVKLERVRVSYSRAGEDAPPAEERSVAELLGGRDEVPPGAGVEAAFVLDTKAHPDAMMADYLFEGHTPDGIKVLGTFSIMAPPKLPTPETGTPVGDPLLTQKILRAREKLGKPFVNDEDLRQLELAGVFADLQAAPDDPEAAAPAAPAAPSPAVLEAARAAKRRPLIR